MTLLSRSIQLRESHDKSWYASVSHSNATYDMVHAPIALVSLHRVRFNKQPNRHNFVDFFIEFTSSSGFIKLIGAPRQLTEQVRSRSDQMGAIIQWIY